MVALKLHSLIKIEIYIYTLTANLLVLGGHCMSSDKKQYDT